MMSEQAKDVRLEVAGGVSLATVDRITRAIAAGEMTPTQARAEFGLPPLPGVLGVYHRNVTADMHGAVRNDGRLVMHLHSRGEGVVLQPGESWTIPQEEPEATGGYLFVGKESTDFAKEIMERLDDAQPDAIR